jgi:branched-chain amino acid transport system ATP-binding protein
VPDATTVALLGPNGAGKTTLLRTAAGFIRPTSGRVMLDGEDVTGLPAHIRARRGLCHLPEGRGIFPTLSVRDNLVLQSTKGKGGEADGVERALSTFPLLAGRLRQQAGSLSGGEQQMLALARTFLCDPKLVVVDEASLGLAPLVVNQIFTALGTIVAAGTALLLVEQYVSRALDLADSVYILNRGQIVFSGPAQGLAREDVFEHYLGITVGR